MFEVRTRNWWRENPEWPNGLEPHAEPWKESHRIAKGIKTEAEAREICQNWNATHKPGRLSRKAEYSET